MPKLTTLATTLALAVLIGCTNKSKPADTNISPVNMDADYCLDFRSRPKAVLVKKYRDLEPALLNISKKQKVECDYSEYYYFYFFEKERNWIFPITSTLICIMAGSIGPSHADTSGNERSACHLPYHEISPVEQINFPESEIIDFINFEGEEMDDRRIIFRDTIVDEKIHKKEELLQFKDKIIDVEIYKEFSCRPILDTTLSIKFRARIIGECENLPPLVWSIGATDKDSVIAEFGSGGRLFIRGKGKMMDFEGLESRPWDEVNNEITKVIIESGVTYIGSYAFLNCYLTSVTIPSSVASMGEYALDWHGLSFNYTDELSIVASLGTSTFHKNGLISVINPDTTTSITIPEEESSAHEDIFSNFKNIRTITVLSPEPPNLYGTEGEITTFHGINEDSCTLYVPKGSVNAYRKANGWREFRNIMAIGDTVSAESPKPSEPKRWLQPPWNIGATSKDSLFAEFNSEGTLVIRGVGKMMDFDFTRDRPWNETCRKKKTIVVIDSGLTSIGKGAFMNCEGLTSISIPNSVTSIGERSFANSYNLKSITIPNSLTSIGNYAFYNNRLTSIFLPSSVTSIGDKAFYDSIKLTSLTISGNKTSIGYGAFTWSYSLESITISNPTPPPLVKNKSGEIDAFYHVGKTCTLYVPKGSVDAYRKAEGWKEFKNIKAIE